MSSSNLNVYIDYGKRREEGKPVHWLLIYAPENAQDVCTWVHVTGGPQVGYELEILAGKRFDSHEIPTKKLIGTTPAIYEQRIKGIAKTIPMQNCQRFVAALVAKLEEKGLLPLGVTAEIAQQIEPGCSG